MKQILGSVSLNIPENEQGREVWRVTRFEEDQKVSPACGGVVTVPTVTGACLSGLHQGKAPLWSSLPYSLCGTLCVAAYLPLPSPPAQHPDAAGEWQGSTLGIAYDWTDGRLHSHK